MPYLGRKKDVDPRIVQLASRPHELTDPTQREDALNKAQAEAAWDAAKNRVVVNVNGEPYWGHEYPNVFTFKGQLCGRFDHVPADRTKWTPPMELVSFFANLGGDNTHVIIKLADGDQVMIRKTS